MSPSLLTRLRLLSNDLPIAIDYETEIPGKGGSVEYYRHDFRASSLALAYYFDGGYHTDFVQGHLEIRHVLECVKQHPIIVHNLMFEYGVTRCCFPDTEVNWHADTMRMAQLADNGGKAAYAEVEESLESEIQRLSEGVLDEKRPIGLGLGNVVKRWLPKEFHGHKEKTHKLLVEHALTQGLDTSAVKKNPGSYLYLLTLEEMREYNCKDAEVTLRLFHRFEEYAIESAYDYRPDHEIYIGICKLTAKSKIDGVAINRSYLINSCQELVQELDAIGSNLRKSIGPHIDAIEIELKNNLISSYRTEKGKNSAIEKIAADPSICKFNINSTKQKCRLFEDILGIAPKFFTKSGKPSFKKAVLGQWGEAGLLLQKRGTVLISLKQAEKLLKKSEYDGRWHIDINPAGTTTGRMAGTGGLNVQAMARRDPRLMAGIKADPGYVIISRDLTAGEPSVIAHFSKDQYYRSAILDMVGKAPYYDQNDVLMINDIYLMGMSVSPIGKSKLRKIFGTELFNGNTFSEQWLKNPEVITKGILKKDREIHKILILGVGYEMGAAKMVESTFEKGYYVSVDNARHFIRGWWKLMTNVDKIRRGYQLHVKKHGSFMNFFGYRLVPDKPHKAFNYFIQSSVNGVINILCLKHFAICSEEKFIAVIHDEIISQVPIKFLKKSEECFKLALDSLNEDLNWSINIQTGYVTGKDFYEAK